MTGDRMPYRFVNEDPDWCYEDLVYDEDPAMVEERRRINENRDWEYLNIRPLPHEQQLEGDFWALMSLPPSKRRRKVLRATDLYPELALYFLTESEKDLARGYAETSDDRARTAEWIADRLPSYHEAVPEIRARSRSLQATARQVIGKPREADILFCSALDALAECREPLAWAFFFKTIALVREQQGRFAEAAAWLSQACRLYREDRHPHSEKWCLRRLSRLYLRMNDPGRALAVLAQVGLESASNYVKAEAFLGMAVCFAAFEMREPARDLLQQSRSERRRIRDQERRIPLEWWDARIALRLGDLEDAIPRLEGVRRDHLKHQRWPEACSASVDLLLAYALTGAATRESRPDVFGQLSLAFQEDRKDLDFLPFAEERKLLEAALREAAEVLEQETAPEAAACRAFLDHVRSLPPSPRALLLLRRMGWGCGWHRNRKRPEIGSREDIMQLYAVWRRPGKVPEDEERPFD